MSPIWGVAETVVSYGVTMIVLAVIFCIMFACFVWFEQILETHREAWFDLRRSKK